MRTNSTEPTKHAPAQGEVLTRNAAVSRWLLWGLVLFCAAMMLLGPTIADKVLALLSCRPGVLCGLFVDAIGSKFAAFYRADSLVDVPFIFLQNFWLLITAWAGLIIYLRLRPQSLSLAKTEEVSRLLTFPQSRLLTLHAPLGLAAYQWISLLAWALSICVVLFCILLGTPLVATQTASWILSQLGCNATANVFAGSSECLDAAGFWTPRLRDYIGLRGIFAPVWLIENFFDVILGSVLINMILFYVSYRMKPRDDFH
jgi:hypothetical protein